MWSWRSPRRGNNSFYDVFSGIWRVYVTFVREKSDRVSNNFHESQNHAKKHGCLRRKLWNRCSHFSGLLANRKNLWLVNDFPWLSSFLCVCYSRLSVIFDWERTKNVFSLRRMSKSIYCKIGQLLFSLFVFFILLHFVKISSELGERMINSTFHLLLTNM